MEHDAGPFAQVGLFLQPIRRLRVVQERPATDERAGSSPSRTTRSTTATAPSGGLPRCCFGRELRGEALSEAGECVVGHSAIPGQLPQPLGNLRRGHSRQVDQLAQRESGIVHQGLLDGILRIFVVHEGTRREEVEIGPEEQSDRLLARTPPDEVPLLHQAVEPGGLVGVEASWEEIIAKICAARPEPRWALGQTAGYHLGSSWFILGEVIRRVDGRPFSEYVREEIFEPLGMNDSWVGMPQERFEAYGDRLGRMYGTENAYEKGGEPIARGWHRAPHVVGCAPGGNGYGPIRELGRFYEMMLDRGRADRGHAATRRILTPQSVEALTVPHRVGLMDKTFKVKLDWGLGFICDSKHYQSGDAAGRIPYGYGRWASRRTFGHSGFQSSTGFADPEHGLVVAALTNGQPGEENNTERFRQIAEAIYEDLGLAPARPGTT